MNHRIYALALAVFPILALAQVEIPKPTQVQAFSFEDKDWSVATATKPTAIQAVNVNDVAGVAQAFATAKQVSTDLMIKETGNYLSLEEGESYMVLVKGITTIEDTINEAGGDVDAVELMLEDGSAAINADIVMVSTAKRMIAAGVVPCICYIFVKGKKGEKGRQYKDLDIRRVPTTQPAV